MLGDVAGQLGHGGDHLPVGQRFGVGQGGFAAAVVAEGEQVAGAAPVGVGAGHDGVKHRLHDLRASLGG